MVRIILVRHGQTVWNVSGQFQGQSDIELTEEGKEQARKLRDNFPFEHIDKIYCSDLKRARETAETVAERFSLPVEPCKELREMCYGDWEGQKFAEINKRYDHILDRYFVSPDTIDVPGGENFEILQKRAMRKLDEIIANNEGKTILVVAHGAINRAILGAILGMPINFAWRIAQYNTCVNVIRIDGALRCIELINSTEHLKVK